MSQKQEAMLTYGCTRLLPQEMTALFAQAPLANFEPKAIVIPEQPGGMPGLQIVRDLDTMILDDEAVDLSGTKQGPGFVRCELPEKTRAWTTGKQYQLSLISKVEMAGFQVYVIGVIP
jgi:hypothetical protein